LSADAQPDPRRPRAAGLLLHPTSLPGPFGSGDLGPPLVELLDWAASAGLRLWQVLPLGPSGHGYSPYASRSAFAGEPLLVSPERMVEEGWLEEADLELAPEDADPTRIDFEAVAQARERMLRGAWQGFQRRASAEARAGLETFCREHAWLEDWALYSALRVEADSRAWHEWDSELARREAGAIEAARERLASEVGYHRFVQYAFARQWRRVREEAARRGIAILGDMPIYAAHDCAEVWAQPELFELDEAGQPTAVAGVPPDFFSETGQRWGNPLFRWERLRETGYAWWIERLRANLELTDLVRIDHFRAFAAYWSVPAEAETAVGGRWLPGPGLELFEAVAAALGSAPIVAEDLGTITADVRALLAATGFPGMQVLQFAFAEPDSLYLPHRHQPNSIVYTGTHDNDTTRGWFEGADPEERERALDYLGARPETLVSEMIRAAYTSVADRAVIPAQDVLELGSEGRMNTPGEAEGNWGWRLRPGALEHGSAARLRRLAELSGRLA
jgi:4-alpha-glucanotransferase